MSARKQSNRVDSVRDAATGYTVVVLAIICFILALVAVIAAVRLVVGFGLAPGVSTNATTSTSVAARSASNGIGAV